MELRNLSSTYRGEFDIDHMVPKEMAEASRKVTLVK